MSSFNAWEKNGKSSGVTPGGPAGGDLSGTYPNPAVVALEETGDPARLAVGAIPDGDLLRRVGNTIEGVTVIEFDELVKVSATDDAAGYLVDKVVAGTGISLTKLNPGGDEQYQISASSQGVPNVIANGVTFSVPDNNQVLYARPILINAGGQILINGTGSLVGVT